MGGSPTVEVRLLGPVEVSVDGSPVVFDTRKALGLLSYLIVEGSGSRDTIAGLFWTDSTQDRARATLRRTLSSLRSGIGSDLIVADRHRIELHGVSSDVVEFDALLREVSSHDHVDFDVCGSCVEPLSRAADLYRGDFLHGLSLRDAVLFEDWERGVAEEFRRRAGDVFRRLAAAHASNGDYSAAIIAVNRWVEIDPLHEPAHRQLMLLHAWWGDRAGAIDAYRSFSTTLDRELAVSPLEETTELYEAILDEDLPRAPSAPRPVRASGSTALPSDLIGRSSEMTTLRTALDESKESPRVVIITGRAWMGKTRLIEEITREAIGRTVLSGRAHRSETGLPFGLIAQLLRSLDIEILREELPDWVSNEVGRIVPQFAHGQQDSADPLGEIRLLESLENLMVHVASTGPILITVDDAQWMDRASARALNHVLGRIGSTAVLSVVALRSGEPLAPDVRNLVSPHAVVQLEPLREDELPEDVEDPAELIARTGGVPILVAEQIAGRDTSSMVERYVETRLEGLSDLATQVLGVASVVAGSCTDQMLRAVSGRSEDEVVDGLDELTTAGLLKEPSSSDEYTFALDAAVERTYGDLTLARRRLLHRRAGEALASQPRATTELRTAALASDHFQRAGDDRASHWLQTAGDLARRSYANEEAVGYYETALALGSEEQCDLHISLAEVAMTLGDYEKALSVLDVATGRCPGEDRGRVDHLSGEVHRLLGRFDLASERFEQAVSAHPEPVRVYADWALLAHRTGDSSKAQELASKALEALGDSDGDAVWSRVHNVNGAVSASPEVALGHLDRAVELANGDEVALMAALNTKARLVAASGDLDGAMKLVERAVDLAAKTGHRHREAALLDFLADLHHRAGDIEAARTTQTRAMALFAGIDRRSIEPEIWLLSTW